MKNWKHSLKWGAGESTEEEFKRIWNNLVYLGKSKLAFQFFLMKYPEYEQLPVPAQLEVYKKHLTDLGLIS